MSRIAAPRNRLQAGADSEHEQPLLRIVIYSLVLTFSLDSTSVGHVQQPLAFGLAAALVLAIALFVGICVWPAPSIPRRITGLLADSGVATFVMFLTGEAGVSMIAAYLFITFGNGFRYGRAYLFGCQALCLAGFSAVLLYAPYWDVHSVTGSCLMLALVVLPLYVSTFLKRIYEAWTKAEEARAIAEQALKECLVRERHAG